MTRDVPRLTAMTRHSAPSTGRNGSAGPRSELNGNAAEDGSDVGATWRRPWNDAHETTAPPDIGAHTLLQVLADLPFPGPLRTAPAAACRAGTADLVSTRPRRCSGPCALRWTRRLVRVPSSTP